MSPAERRQRIAHGVLTKAKTLRHSPHNAPPSMNTSERLAYATLYNLLQRMTSEDMAPTAEEIIKTLATLDKRASLGDLIVLAWDALTPEEREVYTKRMRVLRIPVL